MLTPPGPVHLVVADGTGPGVDSAFRLVAGETRATVTVEGRDEPEPVLARPGRHGMLVLSRVLSRPGTDAREPVFECAAQVEESP